MNQPTQRLSTTWIYQTMIEDREAELKIIRKMVDRMENELRWLREAHPECVVDQRDTERHDHRDYDEG